MEKLIVRICASCGNGLAITLDNEPYCRYQGCSNYGILLGKYDQPQAKELEPTSPLNGEHD